ncbi:beta-aspartyl-peptidase [Alkalicoccus chagannorensis]|uniref:beta-aspartyl-peptidase n=1 Tax=Alkalicoccus chagannorensis TaxID=427072 RepID=UPI000426BBEE|nr:beta-aspartyl-peptidase [Alkalicoccus chagannorensis]
MSRIHLIQQSHLFTPEDEGQADILIAGGRIAAVRSRIEPSDEMEVTDGRGLVAVPGLVDGHVHITGGGGEGGFHTRTPPLALQDCLEAGVTTVVGVIGTDGITRSMEDLTASAKGLTNEGLSCYCMTGSYHFPLQTLTGSIQKDLLFVQEIIGTGEAAVADHRSSQPSLQQLKEAAAASRTGGMLAGKGGKMIVHVGPGAEHVTLLEQAVRESDLPITQFLPTHINRSRGLLEAGRRFAEAGGIIDLTTSALQVDDELLEPARAYMWLKEQGVPADAVTFSSDAQGSLPVFDEQGSFSHLGVGRMSSMLHALQSLYLHHRLPLEEALRPVTSSPAAALGLKEKGRLKAGFDADLLLVNKETLEPAYMMARGSWLKTPGWTKAAAFEQGQDVT